MFKLKIDFLKINCLPTCIFKTQLNISIKVLIQKHTCASAFPSSKTEYSKLISQSVITKYTSIRYEFIQEIQTKIFSRRKNFSDC